MPRSNSPRPNISLFDVFLGSGRTIRSNRGLPGTHYIKLNTDEPDKKADSIKGSSSSSKPGSSGGGANGSGKSTPKAGSAKEGSSGDAGSKPSSKPSSKPASIKATSHEEVVKAPAEESKAAETPAANSGQKLPDAEFTPEQDAQLLVMKAEGKSWPEIADSLGKFKKQVTKRFHDIKPDDWRPQKGDSRGINKIDEETKAAEAEKVKETKKVDEDKENKQKSEKGSKKQEMAEPEETVEVAAPQYMLVPAPQEPELVSQQRRHRSHDSSSKDHHHHHHHHHRSHHHDQDATKPHKSHHHRHDHDHNQAPRHRLHHHTNNSPPPSLSLSTTASTKTRLTVQSLPSLTEDDLFSFGELQAISELIDKDMQNLWSRVSASFFGVSGRRIAAGDLRRKFEALEGR